MFYTQITPSALTNFSVEIYNQSFATVLLKAARGISNLASPFTFQQFFNLAVRCSWPLRFPHKKATERDVSLTQSCKL